MHRPDTIEVRAVGFSVVRWLLLRRPVSVLLTAVAAFVGLFALSKVLDSGSCDEICLLLVLPIMLLAARFGRWISVAAAVVALAVCAIWALLLTPGVDYRPIACVTHGAVFVLVGFGIGWYAEQLRAAVKTAYASEEHYRSLVENSPHAITIFEVDTGSFSYLNPRAAGLFGVSRGRLMPPRPTAVSSSWEMEGSSPLEALQERIAEVVNGDGPIVFAWIFRNTDGQDLLCQVQLVRLPHPTQTLFEVIITEIANEVCR